MYFFSYFEALCCELWYHTFKLSLFSVAKYQSQVTEVTGLFFFFRKKKFLKKIKRGAKSWRPNYYFLSECYLFALIYIWLFNDRFWLKMDWFSMKFATSDIVINVLVQQNKKTRFWFHASYNTMYGALYFNVGLNWRKIVQ